MHPNPTEPTLGRRAVLVGAATVGVGVATMATGCGSPRPPVPPPSSGTVLAAVADIPAGSALVVTVGGAPMILALSAGGTVVAHTAICTHRGCTVKAEGPEAVCPCHGSKFNPQTGAVLRGPAALPLAAIPITVVGGRVLSAEPAISSATA